MDIIEEIKVIDLGVKSAPYKIQTIPFSNVQLYRKCAKENRMMSVRTARSTPSHRLSIASLKSPCLLPLIRKCSNSTNSRPISGYLQQQDFKGKRTSFHQSPEISQSFFFFLHTPRPVINIIFVDSAVVPRKGQLHRTFLYNGFIHIHFKLVLK